MVSMNLGFLKDSAGRSLFPRAGASSTRHPAKSVAQLGQAEIVYIKAVMRTTSLVKRG